jgi:hypothetical protein
MAAFWRVSALNRVVLPTSGSPIKPTFISSKLQNVLNVDNGSAAGDSKSPRAMVKSFSED